MFEQKQKKSKIANPEIVFAILFTIFLLSNVANATNETILVTTNRFVILDDPSGWINGWSGNNGVGNQWSGESTTIRWYVLLMNSSGRAAQGITVTSQLLFPNGSVAITKTSATNSLGIAEFNQNMDNWLQSNGSGSEGTYTIDASATVGSASMAGRYNFIYDEWGCGSSGTGCHNSQYWQNNGNKGPENANKWASGSVQNSPYLHAWDNYHSSGGHGSKGSIGTGECLTCHRGFDGTFRTHNNRVTSTPQYAAAIHYGKTGAKCTDCHSTFGSGTMPIKQCYDCHPKKNDNLTVKNFIQTATSGFSYRPLTTSNIKAHNEGQEIPCIICHNGMHNVSKPYNVTETSNTYTEYQQCKTCHAAYNRHNNNVSCTVCHSQDVHVIKVLTNTGSYINGSTSPSRGNCTNCHQNNNFLNTLLSQPKAGSYSGSAPQIPAPLNHSTDRAGSKWGNYWTEQKDACIYCHSDSKHKLTALGNILVAVGSDSIGGPIDNGTVCSSCHNPGDSNYNDMMNVLNPDPVANRPGNSNWNTSGVDHTSFGAIVDADCKLCHGGVLSENPDISEFPHNVDVGKGGNNCLACHRTDQGIYPAILESSFGKHKNINKTDGIDNLTNSDCQTCHYNISNMLDSGFTVSTFLCTDCHTQGNYSAPIIKNHRPNGVNITTTAYCSVCHNNSINNFAYSINASVSHYGTKNSLIKTVNQTPMPGFGFITQADALSYNKECYNCHNQSNPNNGKYGNATPINVAHISTGICNECHVNDINGNIDANNFHNITLGKPLTYVCIECHTTYAYTYKAPNLTGTYMNSTSYRLCEQCHGGESGASLTGQLDTLSKHNNDRKFAGTPGSAGTVYLNGQTTVSVPKGSLVTITSRVNDMGSLASRVGGAEYYIDTDPGLGKGIPLNAVDGQYDAVNGEWENIIESLDSANMALGTHTVYVRGMDIGKQWSAPVAATLIITEPKGFVNGTVRDSISGPGIQGVTVITNNNIFTLTDTSGFYSLSLINGTYTLTASKDPEYYANNTIAPAIVIADTTVIRDITLTRKPVYTLSGRVINASSGSGINGALINLVAYPQYNATTNSTGDYSMSVPEGTYQVSASAPGYVTNTTTVTVSANTSHDFILTNSYKVYVPWTATTQGWTTPFVIANKGNSNANVDISYYNQADGSYAGNYSLIILPGASKFVFREWTTNTDGSAVLISDQPITVMVDQFNNGQNKFGAYEVDQSGSTEVLLPWTATTAGWTTPYVIVNQGVTNATANITYYYINGSVAGSYSVDILPGASKFVFREWSTTSDGAARISSSSSSQPISVLVDMFNNAENKFGAYTPASIAASQVFIPWTATTQGWTTPIKIVNMGSASAVVNISYYNQANGLLAGSDSVSIAPNEVVTVLRESSTANGTDGSAVINSTQPVSVIVQQFNNNEGKFEVYTPAMIASNTIVIPWTSTTQGWTTPYVIVNKGNSNASVDISYYNQADGLNVGTYSVNILPGASKFVFREWTTNTDGSAVLVSDQPITVMVDQFNNGQNKFGAYTPIG